MTEKKKVENENEAEAMRRVLRGNRSEIYRCRCQVWSGDPTDRWNRQRILLN